MLVALHYILLDRVVNVLDSRELLEARGLLRSSMTTLSKLFVSPQRNAYKLCPTLLASTVVVQDRPASNGPALDCTSRHARINTEASRASSAHILNPQETSSLWLFVAYG